MLPIDPRTATMDLGSAPALVKHANTNAHIPTTARADGKGNEEHANRLLGAREVARSQSGSESFCINMHRLNIDPRASLHFFA